MKPEQITIDGPAGRLEAMVQVASGAKSIAVICHPHPLHQGTMHNKVVTTLAKAYELCGVATIRFNYRGVGASDGCYGNIDGEVDDAQAVVDYANDRFPGLNLAMAGFSFGSFVAARVANQLPCQSLVSIAPAVHHADYDSLAGVACPWLVVMGGRDELVPLNQVQAWVERPPAPLQYELMPEASHFFHGCLIELRQLVVDFIST